MEQVQLTLFDEIEDPINTLLKCWVETHTTYNSSVKELEQILKNEKGVGGFLSPIQKPNYVHWGVYNKNGVELEGTDRSGNIRKIELTWSEVAGAIMEMF